MAVSSTATVATATAELVYTTSTGDVRPECVEHLWQELVDGWNECVECFTVQWFEE